MHFSLRMRHGLGSGQVRSTILRQFFFSISPLANAHPQPPQTPISNPIFSKV